MNMPNTDQKISSETLDAKLSQSDTHSQIIESDAPSAEKQQEILEKFDRESITRKLKHHKAGWIISAIAIAYALFHLFITFNPMPALLQRAIHVGVGFALIFVIYPATKKSSRVRIAWYDWVLFLMSLSGVVYLMAEYQDIVTIRGGIPNQLDIIFAIITVLCVLEGTRRITGFILPLFALVFLAYPFFSHLDFMPDRLLTRAYDIGDIFGQLYLKTEGLYSTAIGASVTFIFLFILFGAFLSRSGMGQLFNDLALAIAGHKQGGPAKVAVISSGFMGSINGAAVANMVWGTYL